jgi:hypothetical protein
MINLTYFFSISIALFNKYPHTMSPKIFHLYVYVLLIKKILHLL